MSDLWTYDWADHLAYIDPGSGSLIVQAAIATLVAVPFIFRTQIGRAVRAIRRSASERTPVTEEAASPEAKRHA